MPPELEPVVVKESWVHRHVYLSTSIAIFALLVFGTYIISGRTVNTQNAPSGTWGGIASVFSAPPSQKLTPAEEAAARPTTSQPVVFFTPFEQKNTQGTDGNAVDSTDAYSLLLAELSKQQPAGGQSGGTQGTPDAYSFIPKGLISITSEQKTRTPVQQDLYEYGNQIGGTIRTFDGLHTNTPQILKDQAEDRTNPLKADALNRLGADMQDLGDQLKQMDPLPPGVATIHKAYAEAYISLGKNLILIASAKTDDDFVKAIGSFNDSSDAVTKQFLGLVTLFSANSVSFSGSDPGSIFMFNQSVSF